MPLCALIKPPARKLATTTAGIRTFAATNAPLGTTPPSTNYQKI
jgi:hypothetical protein